MISPLILHTIVDQLQMNYRLCQLHVQEHGSTVLSNIIVTRIYPARYLPKSWRKRGVVLHYLIMLAATTEGRTHVSCRPLRRQSMWLQGASEPQVEYMPEDYYSFLPHCSTVNEIVFHVVGWEKNILRKRPHYITTEARAREIIEKCHAVPTT